MSTSTGAAQHSAAMPADETKAGWIGAVGLPVGILLLALGGTLWTVWNAQCVGVFCGGSPFLALTAAPAGKQSSLPIQT
jgi:hypothetical protein